MHGVSLDRLQISSAMLSGLPEFCSSAGLDYRNIAEAVGLSDVDVEDDEQYVNLDRFAKFLEIAAILTGDEGFGLHFADWRFPTPTGPLSFALCNAPDMRTALSTLVRYIATRVDVAHVELVIESDRAIIDWALSPLLVRRWQLCDYSAAALMRQTRSIVDTGWRPLAIGLVRPAPRSPEAHRRVLGRAIEFSQRTNSIAFPLSILSLPIKNANPAIYRMACRLLDRILAECQAASDLITSVREEIILALPTEEGPRLKRVARRLGLSERSLQRHLADNDTSFQDLIDETRKALAARYLEDPSLTFSQIAYQLGFSAPSAFTRASYRWFGRRPGAVRRDARHGHPAL